ncbi:MAG: hypothetical protein ACTSYC_01490 [Promethearchaeota archaeon]
MAQIIEGIEGDYIETKKDHLFFDVKGILHPSDRKICFIRFYPDPAGNRIKNGLRYKKIYDLKKRFEFLNKNYPQYLFYSQQWDVELQGVKNEDIKKIYTPREYLKSLTHRSNLTRLEKCSLELCSLFISEGNLPEHTIGISGSPMVGLYKDDSDIDLIIYGTEISKQFQEYLPSIFEDNNFCRKYTLSEYQTHYEWRVGGSDIPFDMFLFTEQRKLHQGMYKGFEFFIRYIKSPKDWCGSYDDYKFKNLGRISLKAKIINSDDSIFTPCSYQIEPQKILHVDIKDKEIMMKEIKEISSFRGRFCEQAKAGENVLVEGKLEKVYFQDKLSYYRILLQDQVLDKMIVLN